MKKTPHLWTATPLICRYAPVCVSPGYLLIHLWLKTTKFNKNNFKNQKAFGCKCQEEAINAVCVTFSLSRTKTTSNYHLARKRKTNKQKLIKNQTLWKPYLIFKEISLFLVHFLELFAANVSLSHFGKHFYLLCCLNWNDKIYTPLILEGYKSPYTRLMKGKYTSRSGKLRL